MDIAKLFARWAKERATVGACFISTVNEMRRQFSVFSNATTKYLSLFLYFLSSRFSGYKPYYFHQSTQLFCSIASKRSFVLTFLTSRTRSCIFLILIFHNLVLLLNEKKIINFSRIKLPLLHLQILLKNFGRCLDECFHK